jgi:hypothetical protein
MCELRDVGRMGWLASGRSHAQASSSAYGSDTSTAPTDHLDGEAEMRVPVMVARTAAHPALRDVQYTAVDIAKVTAPRPLAESSVRRDPVPIRVHRVGPSDLTIQSRISVPRQRYFGGDIWRRPQIGQNNPN